MIEKLTGKGWISLKKQGCSTDVIKRLKELGIPSSATGHHTLGTYFYNFEDWGLDHSEFKKYGVDYLSKEEFLKLLDNLDEAEEVLLKNVI